MSQGHACKTLDYILGQHVQLMGILKSADISKLVINVTYNQTIRKTLPVTLPSFECIKEISIVASNNAFINFEHAGTSILISQEVNEIGFYWSWIGLGFAYVGQSTVDNDFNIPQITMLLFYDFTVSYCKFVSVSLYSEFTQGIVINDNVFGNNGVVSLDLTNPAIIANNTFENYCQHNPGLWNSVLDIQVKNHSIKIVNNSFANIKDSSYRSVISVSGAPAGILIQKNQFIGNTMSSIAIDAVVYNEAFIGNPCTWCNMQDNNFQNNHFGNKEEPILVSIKAHIVTNVCPMEFFSDQNSFENNTHTRLLTTEIEEDAKYTELP